MEQAEKLLNEAFRLADAGEIASAIGKVDEAFQSLMSYARREGVDLAWLEKLWREIR